MEHLQTSEGFTVYGSGDPCEVTVVLDSFKANDYFATNLELTGYANWFGSINMCNMIGEDAQTLFPSKGCRLLELGSGTGRAGIMAAKTMAYQECYGSCVLTDGEQVLVDILRQNCLVNELDERCISCQQLWWGSNPILDKLCYKEPSGFDVIIGADLIYGPDAASRVQSMFYSVRALLAIEGKFYMAFTKREAISVDEVIRIATTFGLKHTYHENFTFDIFGNNVTADSYLWRDAILMFSKRPNTPPSPEQKHQADTEVEVEAEAETETETETEVEAEA